MIATAVIAMMLAQQPTFFSQTFPNPTANNGWEQYAMAADIVSFRGAERLVNYYYYDNQEQGLKGDLRALKFLGRVM
ncbi:MAG: hypothetical protein ABIV13_03810 [Fimbriimonadales bacterium]